MEFRKLRADEISVRVGTESKAKDSFTLLLYKDARCDMNILDETLGTMGWQRKHYMLGEDVYCSVGIYDKETNQWIWKDDCGSAGNFEQEKSKSSDSFKRSCFNIGIGRELYTSPTIRVKEPQTNFYKFRVARIDYNDNGEIAELVIEGMRKEGFKWDTLFSMRGNHNTTKQTEEKTHLSKDVKLAALRHKTAKGNCFGDLHRDQLEQIIHHIASTPEDKKDAMIVIQIFDEQEKGSEFLSLETADALGFNDGEKLPWE